MELAEKMSRLTVRESTPIVDPIDNLVEDVFKLTLEERNVTQDNPGAPDDVPPASALAGLQPLFNRIGDSQYQRLSRIDERVNLRCKDVLSRLDSLASPDSTIDQEVLCFLEKEDEWLQATLQQVDALLSTNQSAQLLKGALIERLESIIDAVDCYKIILSDRVPNSAHEEASIYDSGK